MIIALVIISLLLLSATVVLELKRDLMMFQQNSYRIERYNKWLNQSKDTTSISRLIGFIFLFAALAGFTPPLLFGILATIFGAIIVKKLSVQRYKKPLVWTARATRIYVVAAVIVLAIAATIAVTRSNSNIEWSLTTAGISLLGAYCLSHVVICAANIILKPVEAIITRRYYNDAHRRLESMKDLIIIGITGSYGKTSTKHYLHRILSEQFDTLMTPGSFNTTLGVVRTIREYLKPYNEVFIVEMGAKQRGDVKEICDLVHPQMGIITAVGPQHLESFKTIENVQTAKFELADALPSDGLAVINNDFEKIADRNVTNTNVARYAVNDSHANYRATKVKYTPDGTTFTVESPDGWTLDIATRLMGECNVSDLLAAIIVAHQLGISDAKITAAISTIEPVEHRLSVKRTPGGITILDDAFNSNPVGSRMALEVLGSMTDGKRIVITPGMIELGDEQFELNRQLGETIAKNVDVAIIVGQYNRNAIIEGISNVEDFPNEAVHIVDSFNDAQKLLATIATKGDTILYENDLPDTFK